MSRSWPPRRGKATALGNDRPAHVPPFKRSTAIQRLQGRVKNRANETGQHDQGASSASDYVALQDGRQTACQPYARVTIIDSEGAAARGCPRHAVAALDSIAGAHVDWADFKGLNEWERKAPGAVRGTEQDRRQHASAVQLACKEPGWRAVNHGCYKSLSRWLVNSHTRDDRSNSQADSAGSIPSHSTTIRTPHGLHVISTWS